MATTTPPSTQLGKLRRFVIVGGLSAIVDLGGMQALIALGLGPLMARAISLPLSMLTAFALNRAFTFGASGDSPAVELVRYAGVSGTAALVNFGVFAGILAVIPATPPIIAAAIGLGVSMWVSFFGYQYFAFAARGRANSG